MFEATAWRAGAGAGAGRGAAGRGSGDAAGALSAIAGGLTPVLAVVSVDDRTAERSAADALAASEAAHRALVAHAPGAALFVDDELRIAAAGGDALPVLAGSDEPVVGRTLWTAFPVRVAQALEPLARLAAFGAAGTGELDDGRPAVSAREPHRCQGTAGRSPGPRSRRPT